MGTDRIAGREDSILLAKRNIVDSIWREARLEGIAVTFPDTREVFEGRVVSGMSVDETIAINNLKRSWAFILDTLDVPVDLDYVRHLNALIGQGIVMRAGDVRTQSVSIGGTSWKPEIPDLDRARVLVDRLYKEEGETAALRAFTALARAQLFWDGNKRTAQLVTNRLLISQGIGVFSVPVDAQHEFLNRLVVFYETGEQDSFVEYMLSSCVEHVPPQVPSDGVFDLD